KNPNSISGNFIEYIFEDTKGIIWLGNNADGINIFNPKREKFKRYSSQPGNPTGLSDDMIYSIFEDPDEMGEMVWIGTDKGGLNHFNRESGQSKVYKHEPQNSFSLIHNSVRAIYKDYYGILWIGTTNGLVTFDERDEKFEFYRGLKDLFSGLNIRTIFDDKINPSRYLWISATGVGMLKFDRETNTIETFDTDPNKKQTLSNRLIRATFADSSGMVWVGTLGGGLNRIDSKTGEIKYYRHSNEDQNSIGDNLILSITEDSNDSTQILWIGTAGGFDKFHVETETFERFSEIDGLPNNVVYGILQDDDGFLWISTNLGISKFDPNTKNFRNYDIYDGLQNNEFNAGAYFKSRSGELFFGGITGFNIFHPDSIKDNEYAPPVFITSFKKFEKEAVTDKSVYLLNQFDLNYDEDFFSFEFAALNFTSPEKNQYAYKMEGFDRNWIYCGTRRYVSYTNLDPGKYTFRVKASNNDGVWNEEGNSVRISISPPFWRTWWAYSFYLIAFGFFAAGSNWVVKNRRSIMALRKRKISHYRLLELIGKGGVGEVFKALDLNSKKIVALKLLSNELLENKENRDRFVREGQVMKSFSHPNIVKTFQFGESEHQGYIAMEYLTGGTLKEFIQKGYPLKRTDIKKIIEQTCFGLQQIHLQGIIHRDIKSANIMLDEEQNVRIMDFGLSRSPLAQTMTTLGTAMGTLGYVAPEQITNFNVDHRVDIFSLGVVFYEMLTNELPFAGENEMALIHSIFNNNPKPPSELINSANKKLDHLILSCLAKQPEERYSSVSDFLEDFERNF
ncbi:MAG: protein kinase, partial [Melioribacteraceae bacterium]|nr:protein kinase [Melioribacteraceae bacterium]